MTTSNQGRSAYDNAKINLIQDMLCARIDEVLTSLEVDLSRGHGLYTGPCPIHDGDNPSALNLYSEGDVVAGFWRCNTRGCHGTFKKTIIGFIRGVLSRRKGWSPGSTKIASWKETIDWCCNFLGQRYEDLKVNVGDVEKRSFAHGVNIVTRKPEQGTQGLTRAVVRKYLKIPGEYFVRRGWSSEVLDKYDVGLYLPENRPLSGRVVVPIYDENHSVAVGFTARATHDQCENCKRWHASSAECPDRSDRYSWGRTAKWVNHQFSKDSYLYNYWFAKQPIRETGTVVLVEGPGDVWRLEEAGVDYAVAMFGVELSDEQQVLLERSGAMNVVVLSDSDSAGEGARRSLQQKLRRSFRLHFPKLQKKDVGEMEVDEVKATLVPVLNKIIGA